LKRGSPASAKVGTSGSSGLRAPVMARPSRVPPCTCDRPDERLPIAMSTRPPTISPIAAAMPRNGTCSALMPAVSRNSSIAICADEPGPPEPKVNSPGFRFPSATSSASVRTPTPGRTIKSAGESAMRLMKARSRSGS